jgi:hypothetical protein
MRIHPWAQECCGKMKEATTTTTAAANNLAERILDMLSPPILVNPVDARKICSIKESALIRGVGDHQIMGSMKRRGWNALFL